MHVLLDFLRRMAKGFLNIRHICLSVYLSVCMSQSFYFETFIQIRSWPLFQYFKIQINVEILKKAGRGAAALGVTAKPTGCGFDHYSRRWNIYLNLYFHFFALVSRLSSALSSATQHAMPPEFGRKWGTECLNTRFPLPTLLCAGYSVKLILIYFNSTQR